MSEGLIIILAALFLDRSIGEPPDEIHPTVFLGKLITKIEQQMQNPLLIFLIVTGPITLLSYLLILSVVDLPRIVLGVIIFYFSISWKGLWDYNKPVAQALADDDLNRARKGIPFIAARDPETLDKRLLISTSVESIAESSVDAVLSPLIFFFFLSFISIELAVASSVFYRATNTLDSMIGTIDNKKGSFSAKVDEILNYIPSRLGGIFLLLSGFTLKKKFRKGVKIFIRDRNNTRSKNGGQTMSAMAGVLGVRLEKKGEYTLGDVDHELSVHHIYEALKIVDMQIICVTILMVIICWI